MSARLRTRFTVLVAAVAAVLLGFTLTSSSASAVGGPWTPDGRYSDPSPITSTWHCTLHNPAPSGYDSVYSCIVASGDYWQGAILFRQNTSDTAGLYEMVFSDSHRNGLTYFSNWGCESYLSSDVWQVCFTSTVHGLSGQHIDNDVTAYRNNGVLYNQSVQSPVVTLP